MLTLRSDDPLATALTVAIHKGDLASLRRLLAERPGLASARIGEAGKSRTPLHVATDWPGHFPNGAATVLALLEAGADPNARCEGTWHTETPLHWVASSDDVEAFDVLVEHGADIEATGGSIGGGTPLDNAVGYGQWSVARRLVERGARVKLWHAAALGLLSRVEECFSGDRRPSPEEINEAFYQACHGGERATAEYLLDRGADVNWIPKWSKGRTPLDVARVHDRAISRRPSAENLVEWLLSRGAKSGLG